MVFSSSVFLFVFLPIVLIGYVICPGKLQNIWLLLASLLFYFWGGPMFFTIILASVLVNYLGGICIDKAEQFKNKKIILGVFLFLNLLNLGYWKYSNFFIDIVENLLQREISFNEVILPIGISFYTFQGISYIIDVYREEVQVQKNPVYVALYICLFPQLIAGPIVRYSDIENQLFDRKTSLDGFEQGMLRFIAGLGKKVILANTMGEIAESIFHTPCEENTVMIAWIGAIAYTFQIYFDFSGYSDMAIGLGQIFGFSFPENFNYPYISGSITEFWRRWHMSLSGWFRDYVYIPMGGNRKGNVYIHLFIVFLLTGIWHGANWTFIVWGIYYGVFIVAEKWCSRNLQIKVPAVLKHLYTLLVVIIGWVIFNADSLEHAKQYIMSMFGLLPLGKIRFTAGWYLNRYTVFMFVIAAIASLPLGKAVWNKVKAPMPQLVQKLFSYGAAVVLLIICMMYVMTSTYNPFIYFQF